MNESFSEPEGSAGAQDVRLSSTRRDAAKPVAGTQNGILDYPHYTRPPSFRGWDVPEVLMSGNHEEIRRWRRKKAHEKTLRNRPDC